MIVRRRRRRLSSAAELGTRRRANAPMAAGRKPGAESRGRGAGRKTSPPAVRDFSQIWAGIPRASFACCRSPPLMAASRTQRNRPSKLSLMRSRAKTPPPPTITARPPVRLARRPWPPPPSRPPTRSRTFSTASTSKTATTRPSPLWSPSPRSPLAPRARAPRPIAFRSVPHPLPPPSSPSPALSGHRPTARSMVERSTTTRTFTGCLQIRRS